MSPVFPDVLRSRVRSLLIVALTASLTSLAFASGPYVIGSSNTVTADPTIPRPKTTPCIVQLLSNAEFDNFNPVPFSFTPPASCPGPWAKVVFTADINVTAGVQYDRTANFWLGPTNIYFGTTAEPGATLAPSWHVESDLTDYSPIFMTSQQGTADIGNLVNGTYTGNHLCEFHPRVLSSRSRTNRSRHRQSGLCSFRRTHWRYGIFERHGQHARRHIHPSH